MKKIKLITGLTLALMFGGVALSPAIAQSNNPGGGGSSDGSPSSSPSNTSPSPSDAGSRDGFQRDMSPQDTQRQNMENPTGVEGQRFDPVRDRDRDGNLIEQENRTNEVDQRLIRQQNEGQVQQNMNQPGTGITTPDQNLDQRLIRQQNEGQLQQNMNQPQQQFPSTGSYEDTQVAPVRGLW